MLKVSGPDAVAIEELSVPQPASLAARLGARLRTVEAVFARAPDPTTAANATDPKTLETWTDGDVSGTAACVLIATSKRSEMVSMLLEFSSVDERWRTMI